MNTTATPINVYKAQATIKDRPVPPVTIEVHQEIPESPSLEKAREIYQNDANTIADGLCRTLPGGTLHHLVAELLRRAASAWRIPDERMAERNRP